ncbi:MAG: alpha/beta fold hydrolase [Thermoflexales bacterium]|nr:alpha/beta fold hydrolase [Thermoflexales bacterium]
MPHILVNGIQLYYESFGDDHPERAPIVLIHGSTLTGQADWRAVAPLLATRYRVIVPDCRGHGQSETTHTYSFKELAADVAALIRALGYERAHLIGHSNGGNVALVTLLDHPEVVQTCIPQAANAYVSQDLIEKEPAIFDPDRVARDDPNWLNEMIALHSPTHGADYWRELLQLTVREIISEPNYTPKQLSKVKRPVLVIQGENDRVNAPMKHAQFIAQHIPLAELWLPSDIGHNVHTDQPLDWLKRVFDFLERRGDDVNDALYRLKEQRYSDNRTTIFEVHFSSLPVGERPGVRGAVLTPDQRRAARKLLPKGSADHIRVLLNDDTPWALVNRSVADVRREPRSSAEQMTQLLIGEAVRVLDTHDNWRLIRCEADGYIGWSRARALHICDAVAVTQYQSAAKWLIAAPLAAAYDRPSRSAAMIGQLPFGARLPIVEETPNFIWLRLPDGRVWWVARGDGLPKAQHPKPTKTGIAATLDRVGRFVGTPYLWGGRSPFGYDCSGLAQAFYHFMGVSIPRDADQQFTVGQPVDSTPQPGDLLYFSDDDDDLLDPRHANITHVALSRGGDEMIHANGTTWNIAYNSLDPASPIYNAWLKEHLVGIRRFR